mmetsp:Transcript_33719/g.54646  ORF Transcript_33719/g.54646 Transcript_33719/m.54646 type:complete len:210 (+) Transcript_33719:1208-1837(+)
MARRPLSHPLRPHPWQPLPLRLLRPQHPHPSAPRCHQLQCQALWPQSRLLLRHLQEPAKRPSLLSWAMSRDKWRLPLRRKNTKTHTASMSPVSIPDYRLSKSSEMLSRSSCASWEWRRRPQPPLQPCAPLRQLLHGCLHRSLRRLPSHPLRLQRLQSPPDPSRPSRPSWRMWNAVLSLRLRNETTRRLMGWILVASKWDSRPSSTRRPP